MHGVARCAQEVGNGTARTHSGAAQGDPQGQEGEEEREEVMPSHPESLRVKPGVRSRRKPAARSRSVPFNARRKAISKRSDKGNAASFVGVLGGNKKRGTTRKAEKPVLASVPKRRKRR